MMDWKKQSISIQLIDNDDQHEEKKGFCSYYSHRLKNCCDGMYWISIGLSIILVIIMIILILLFRINSGRCGLLSTPYQCQHLHSQSDQKT